jgi:hypothetical protein
MIPQRCDQNLIAKRPVNHAVLRGDSSRPVSLQRVFERFRFSDPGVWISRDLLNQEVYARENARIILLPIQVVFPCVRRENEVHTANFNLRLRPLPRLSTSTALISRLAFAGERSR